MPVVDVRKIKIRYRNNEPLSASEEILRGSIEPTPEMLDSPDESVRAALAYIGYGLEALVKDPSPIVRKNVAINFFGLDDLINDPDPKVAETAKRKMERLKGDCL